MARNDQVHGYLLLVEVDDEVLLGLELPGELGGRHVFERALLGIDLLRAVHFREFRNYL